MLCLCSFDVFGYTQRFPETETSEFVLDPSEPFNGIIAYLSRRCRGNVCDKGVVSVSGRSRRSSDYEAGHAVEFWNRWGFCSVNQPGQSLTLDFKNRRVSATAYSLWCDGHGNLTSWALEGSNDGKSWEGVDSRDNDTAIANTKRKASFDIGKGTKAFRMFRIRHIGQNRFGKNDPNEDDYCYSLQIRAFELFGVVVEARYLKGDPVRLVCGGRSICVDRETLLLKMKLFRDHPELLGKDYIVKSSDDYGTFESFMRLVRGETIDGTISDYLPLGRLCHEFGLARKYSFRLPSDVLGFGLECGLRKEMMKARTGTGTGNSNSNVRCCVDDLVLSDGEIQAWIDEEDGLNGIISRLNKACGGSAFESGVILVRGESCDDDHAARHVVELWNDSEYCSIHERNQFICVEFLEHRVLATGYSLMCGSCCYPRSWVLEGSNDGCDWRELDRREYDSSLEGIHCVRTFSTKFSDDFYFIFRLRQLGCNSDGGDCLVLCGFELFGRALSIRVCKVPLRVCENGCKGILDRLNVRVDALGQSQDGQLVLQDKRFRSVNEPNQSYRVDLGKCLITPTHYHLVSSSLQSWVVEASNDGIEWKEIDRHENCKLLVEHSGSMSEYFALECHEAYSKFRVRQIARNLRGRNRLELGGFDIFGSVDYLT